MGNQTSAVSCSGYIENDVIVHAEKAKNDFPFPPREGCVACSCSGRIYVFGGVVQTNHGEGDEPLETNELITFDIASQQWSKVHAKGTPPPARAAASLVAVGSKVYLFGGLSHMFGWFDDVFTFDTVTETWSIMETEGNKPRARDKHQGVAVGTSIYYFGGFGPLTDEDVELEEDDEEESEEIPEANDQEGAEFGWFNDLFVLDTVKGQWSQPMHMNLGVPTPRAAHGMCAVDGNLYIFGGRDIEDRQNDLHIFNIASRKWDTELKVQGIPPAPRSFHSMTAVGKRVVVIGGRGRDNSHFADLHIFDTEARHWLQPEVKGASVGAPRGQHIAEVVSDCLVVFGGTGNFSTDRMQCQDFYRDVWLIKTEELIKGGIKVSHASSNPNSQTV
ncbi:LOW QUALITY PROTEIN: kelch domain-containing protein 1-like [Pomacea canaliculata]|uniref:LOW QUALITY PROTEIN: kelch domain-containing protein 1-like n=1 Tax=Pomacea canaliculata TaxID=400727 RepID=UPI000D736915|nr:LOW QUALITY PROTEIN: kelch domain-containing protein 1-like [Pomacea canaliculata]